MEWWKNKINEVVEMQIGFRANELNRANKLMDKCDENGIQSDKFVVGKRGKQNKWGLIKWRKPTFPLIENNILADKIHIYWNKNKQVPFSKGITIIVLGVFTETHYF